MQLIGGRVAHASFLWCVGVLGWAAVAAAPPSAWPTATWAILFLGVVAGARALAFRLTSLEGDAEVSLDAAIFIAATACLGARPTVIGLGALLFLDGVVRGLVRRRGLVGRRVQKRIVVAHAIYLGGMSAGLLAVCARLFSVGGGVHGADAMWRVASMGGAFLISHYVVQTVQQVLSGRGWRAALARNGIGVVAEATLLPLASAIVLNWDEARPMPFALLGVTYLLVNYGFRSLAGMAADMRRRVADLETLNRTAHALGASLEAPQLIASLLRETARALPKASRIEAVVRLGGEIEHFVLEGDREPRRLDAGPEARALLAFKMAHLEEEVSLAARPEVKTRMVAPLIMYGEVTGALAVESAVAEAFGRHELRLCDAIASQAATAVENARLYALANVDGLTGLYCRRYFDVRIAEEIERARRFNTTFSLLFADLDDFKQLNDTLGHVVGDRALREVAAIAAGQLRGVDLAARYGGEELAFLLPRTGLNDAHAVARRIREAVASYSLVEGGRQAGITLSIGVAGWAESGVQDASALTARADAALYRAKKAGKNRVELDITFDITPALAPVYRRRA